MASYSELIPNIEIYIQLHIKTEAHNSNKIEGTKTTIEEDIMKVEDVSPEKRDDRIEVQNYINAINLGIEKITVEKFPFSTRLIRDLHFELLKGVRGQNKTPGEFRKSQNWIGGSSPSNAMYVPPSKEYFDDLLADFEFFINNDSLEIPILVKIALLHYQFETIHPFLDVNGRIGRLIIPLLLLENNILTKPCFYISNYLEKNRTRYYDALNRVRTENDLIGWIVFFLEAVIETSENAKNKFNKVVKLVDEYREYQFKLKGKPENIAKIFNALYNDPVLSISDMIQITRLSRSTVSSIVREMEKNKFFMNLQIILEINSICYENIL
nr:Fic family protein [uncultured Peptostreptococcus sp.]